MISIHALRGEGDDINFFICSPPKEFQSTPSVGRATNRDKDRKRDQRNFNPRPPWGGRRDHAKRQVIQLLFQSTPSVGRATKYLMSCQNLENISIHALRGEGDNAKCKRHSNKSYISIHALRGEGDKPRTEHKAQTKRFQSTPSVGRATVGLAVKIFNKVFQSTPSVGRATECPKGGKTRLINFNPRPPWGGRHLRRRLRRLPLEISIHALRGEGDIDKTMQFNTA